jgi:RNA polymerase sigma factor (TIGR02999 family)
MGGMDFHLSRSPLFEENRHVLVSHKCVQKGSSISQTGRNIGFRLQSRGHMGGESVEVEHAPATVANSKFAHSPDDGEMLAATYERLRRLAAEYLRNERPDHTLQATALLHEAFLRVLKRSDRAWRNEAHVIALTARTMRRILISYAVARVRQKRGGRSLVRLPLDEALEFCAERDLNLEAIDEALEELEFEDPRQAQIVELRFFAGLSVDEIASTLEISPATVKRDWATAKLWLRSRLLG